MFTNHKTPTYSTLGTGTKVKVLATSVKTSGLLQTRTVLTLTLDSATATATALNAFAAQVDELLYVQAVELRGQVCYVRRTAMAAITDPVTTQPIPQPLAPLVALAPTLPDAPRRALADEVGLLLAETETILVPTVLSDEFERVLFRNGANSWLNAAEDRELTAWLVEDESGILYEGLLAELRVEDDAVDEACYTGWVDPHLDADLVRAWLRLHRPVLAAEIDTALTGCVPIRVQLLDT